VSEAPEDRTGPGEDPMPDFDTTVSMSDSTTEGESTIVVRRWSEQGDADPTAIIDDEATNLIDEDPTDPVDDEAANPVERSATNLIDEDRTNPVERGAPVPPAPDDDPTNVLERERPAPSTGSPAPSTASSSETARLELAGSTTVKPAMSPPVKRRRAALRPAPVPSGFAAPGVRGAGPGAQRSRAPHRASQLRPAPPPPAFVAPARVIGAVPSVARRSRTGAAVSIAAFAVSIAAGASGLIWAVRGLTGL
jgi:hypothetical protein